MWNPRVPAFGSTMRIRMTNAKSNTRKAGARQRQFQFTLRSLFVCTFLAAVMLGTARTLAPYVRRAREQARNATCTNQLRVLNRVVRTPAKTADLNVLNELQEVDANDANGEEMPVADTGSR